MFSSAIVNRGQLLNITAKQLSRLNAQMASLFRFHVRIGDIYSSGWYSYLLRLSLEMKECHLDSTVSKVSARPSLAGSNNPWLLKAAIYDGCLFILRRLLVTTLFVPFWTMLIMCAAWSTSRSSPDCTHSACSL